MSQVGETFFTAIGCMDGRVQGPIARFGQEKFGAKYPDTITEAGLVGILANNPSPGFLKSLKEKIDISITKHYSRGIVVHGHQECAASDAVDDNEQKADIRKSVNIIRTLVNPQIPVNGVFVRRVQGKDWKVEEL